MLKSYGVGWWWWGGGPCDFGVSPSPFELDFGTLDFGTSDSGLTIFPSIEGYHRTISISARRDNCSGIVLDFGPLKWKHGVHSSVGYKAHLTLHTRSEK